MAAIDNVSPDQMSFLTKVKEGHPWGARGRKMKQADPLQKWSKATRPHQLRDNDEANFQSLESFGTDDPLLGVLGEIDGAHNGAPRSIDPHRYIPERYQEYRENPSHLRNDYE